MKQILVFGDGETYANLNGCEIVSIPDDYDAEQIEDALRELRSDVEYIDPTIEQNLRAMPLVGQKTIDQLVDANTARIITRFGEA